MTDKQIIIDGVDVTGCKYFNRFRNICHNKNLCCDCEKNQNCHYKQLARKRQERETLASQLDFEVQKKECLEQECEALKSESFAMDSLITEQKEEIEELKKELDLYKTWYRAKHGDVRDTLERYRKALDEIEKICKVNFYQAIVRQSVDSSMSYLNRVKDIISKAKI